MISHPSESVKVLIRCRPFNSKERLNHSIKCIDIQPFDEKTRQCLIKLISPKKYRRRVSRLFRFDSIYDEHHRTEHLFDDFIQSLVYDVTLYGYSGTVFAYGQTGSGKSWTMAGCPCHSENGLISNAIEYVFNLVQEHQMNFDQKGEEFSIQCAYIEIYNEELHDLLLPRSSSKSSSNQSRLELRENPRSSGVYIANLTWKLVPSIDACLKYKRQGDLARTMGSTQMNRDSSRSHTMFSLAIQCRQRNSKKLIRQGKLNFVDLAGSERQIKTGASGQQLLESAKINLSLSALNKVISSLVHSNTIHIPYRDSKLTRLLQDSIGGTTKTIMIACISPSEDNYDETLCTLRYASRTKNIRNTPIISESSSYALLRQYTEEIQRLRALLNTSTRLSRSMLSTAIQSDDHHHHHHLSADISTTIKCQRTVSCQTIPMIKDRMISFTQTTDERIDDDKQIMLIFDHHQSSYQLLAWHCCQSCSDGILSSLTILVKEVSHDQGWIGTLTISVENDIVIWINHLNHRRYQLYLSEQLDSIITQFEIQETTDSLSLVTSRTLILSTSSGLMVSFHSPQVSSFSHSSILTHFITLQEIDDTIYYLTDVMYSLANPTFVVFLLNSANEYSLHHLILHQTDTNTDIDPLTEQEQIHFEHCCCLDSDNRPIRSQLISCSQFLSLIHMSCEIESEENHIQSTHLQLIDLSYQHRI